MFDIFSMIWPWVHSGRFDYKIYKGIFLLIVVTYYYLMLLVSSTRIIKICLPSKWLTVIVHILTHTHTRLSRMQSIILYLIRTSYAVFMWLSHQSEEDLLHIHNQTHSYEVIHLALKCHCVTHTFLPHPNCKSSQVTFFILFTSSMS